MFSIRSPFRRFLRVFIAPIQVFFSINFQVLFFFWSSYSFAKLVQQLYAPDLYKALTPTMPFLFTSHYWLHNFLYIQAISVNPYFFIKSRHSKKIRSHLHSSLSSLDQPQVKMMFNAWDSSLCLSHISYLTFHHNSAYEVIWNKVKAVSSKIQ